MKDSKKIHEYTKSIVANLRTETIGMMLWAYTIILFLAMLGSFMLGFALAPRCLA